MIGAGKGIQTLSERGDAVNHSDLSYSLPFYVVKTVLENAVDGNFGKIESTFRKPMFNLY